MRIEHIAMYVDDLEGARDFFIQYFEAESNEIYRNQKTGFSSYFLTFQGGARLELMNRPDMEDSQKLPLRTGYIHLAFSAGSREAVDALTERLKADGYEVVSEHFSQHYYNLSVFIGTELRWYFDFRQRYIKNRQTVNNSGWFASIPFTFYTVLYTQSETESRTAHFELAAKIGYRYAFNEHWHIEASLSYIPARIGFYNTIGCSFETSNNLKDMFRLELKAAYVFD